MPSFDMYSFYYACAADGTPQECSIVLTGYDNTTDSAGHPHPVCYMAFEYDPSTSAGLKYSGTMFDCSRGTGMTHLVFSYAPPPGNGSVANAGIDLALDTVSYVSHSC